MVANEVPSEYTNGMEDGYPLRYVAVEFDPLPARGKSPVAAACDAHNTSLVCLSDCLEPSVGGFPMCYGEPS